MSATYRSPAAILDELGVESPGEIDIEAIAQHYGATVLYEPLIGCEARIIGHGDRAFITVSSTSQRPRQRFSAAHELGHWMCDRGKVAFACTQAMFVSDWYHENPETRANRFAAELLLPRKLFTKDARAREMTFSTVSELADRYQTSLTATAIRLVELGSFPAMLVCNESGSRRWKWFVRGPEVPESIWPADQPAADSLAYDLLHGSGREAGPSDVSAAAWFDRERAERYAVCEQSLRSDKFVLSLLWWRDERQLLEML